MPARLPAWGSKPCALLLATGPCLGTLQVEQVLGRGRVLGTLVRRLQVRMTVLLLPQLQLLVGWPSVQARAVPLQCLLLVCLLLPLVVGWRSTQARAALLQCLPLQQSISSPHSCLPVGRWWGYRPTPALAPPWGLLGRAPAGRRVQLRGRCSVGLLLLHERLHVL